MRYPRFFTILLLAAACQDPAVSGPQSSLNAPVDGGAPAPSDGGARAPDLGPALPDAGRVTDSGVVAHDGGAAVADVGLPPVDRCFSDRVQGDLGPDYEPFNPVIGDHCAGTAHQRIRGVEKVVFLGDSVTVGSPPTPSEQFYRSLLARRLARRFDLDPPEEIFGQSPWEIPDMQGGVLRPVSGDFSTCAKWGARNDDFVEGGRQLARCFPDGGSRYKTLIVLTSGGNDIAAITKAGQPDGAGVERARELTETTIHHLRQAFEWIAEPGRFPNGVYVVFANPFEFTDGTGRTDACPAAGAAGFAEPWEQPELLEQNVIWILEQYMALAVEFQYDLVFMMEQFCGHGFVATGRDADPSAACYLGPGAEPWFDLTCTHPNPQGHGALAELFEQVIEN